MSMLLVFIILVVVFMFADRIAALFDSTVDACFPETYTTTSTPATVTPQHVAKTATITNGFINSPDGIFKVDAIESISEIRGVLNALRYEVVFTSKQRLVFSNESHSKFWTYLDRDTLIAAWQKA
jgi:hypothetical protein